MPKTFLDVIRVLFLVNVAVVNAMIVCPVNNAALACKGSKKDDDGLKNGVKFKRTMGI